MTNSDVDSSVTLHKDASEQLLRDPIDKAIYQQKEASMSDSWNQQILLKNYPIAEPKEQGYFILKSCLSVSSPKEHKR
ncbi:MAG: hypothetical protein V7K55_13305 [Nostoc sp.]|uniref:hypothetical protein n=1 Tax=Nostoc sp. TaxID=1180 RepID=UPI002FF54F6E